MAELNHRWMDVEGPTTCWLFHGRGNDRSRAGRWPGRNRSAWRRGAVPEVAGKQAATAGHSVLSGTGAAHGPWDPSPAGYDHAEPEEKAEMFGLQSRLLESWQAAGRMA